MEQTQIKISWYPEDSAPHEILSEIAEFRLVSEIDEPDLVVVDTRKLPEREMAFQQRRRYPGPALFLCQDMSEGAKALDWLRTEDDICLETGWSTEVSLRLLRMHRNKHALQRSSLIEDQFKKDHLTGLFNRRHSNSIVEEWGKTASPNNPISVLLVDLDHFKQLNDTHGHQVGDQMLVNVADIIKKHSSDAILPSRFGGEEFLLVMKSDHRKACDFAEFLRAEIESSPIFIEKPVSEKVSISITASFGVATTTDFTSGEDLIRAADKALYQAKSDGRNCVVANYLGVEEFDDDALRDYENRIRVTTDRLMGYLTMRGRRLAGHYREEADRDGLTGLYRKEYFMRRFSREFENAVSDMRALTLLFLDIDNFGEVNRIYGYPTGDSTLASVSKILMESVRTVDWPARYGGEELCIVMPSTTVLEALSVAERIRKSVEETTMSSYDHQDFRLTVSIGLAELSEGDKAPVDLIQRAGDQTRLAKKSGRNLVCYSSLESPSDS